MKRSIRLVAAVMFFGAVMSLNSFGYSILCQSAPKSFTTSATIQPMFTCAIPANAVPTGKSLRLTAYLHPGSGPSGNTISSLWLNGTDITFTYGTAPEQTFNVIISNAGGTSWLLAGTLCNEGTSCSSTFYQGTSLPWSSGWTLEIGVDGPGNIAYGDVFIVEILD
jgi:hypothetical protein